MSPTSALESILEDAKQHPDIDDITLVSNNGLHIAGKAPEGTHQETYVAMSAILLGAAETATSELKDELEHVLVELENSRIMVQSCGEEILVTKVNPDSDIEQVLNEIDKARKDLIKRL
ncbi:MAG: roadblock/LC7 domain-containing protein [Thermoplasmata archaeon]